MYQQHRSAILSYLPRSDDPERNNFLYKTLFDGFAKIDGKLVETQASYYFFSRLQMKLLLILNIHLTERGDIICHKNPSFLSNKM